MILTVGAILNRRPLPDAGCGPRGACGPAGRSSPSHVVGENRTRPPPRPRPRGDGRRAWTTGSRLDGFVDDAALALRYAAADVAVFLSDYEGFGLPALEAMARGVPGGREPRARRWARSSARPRCSWSRATSGRGADAIERVLDDPALRADLVRAGPRPRGAVLLEGDARRRRGAAWPRRPARERAPGLRGRGLVQHPRAPAARAWPPLEAHVSAAARGDRGGQRQHRRLRGRGARALPAAVRDRERGERRLLPRQQPGAAPRARAPTR